MLTCTKCLQEKDLENFTKDKTRKSGYRPLCKECYNNIRKETYKKPELKESKANYKKENAEVISDYQKEYREKNKAALAEKRKLRNLAKKNSLVKEVN